MAKRERGKTVIGVFFLFLWFIPSGGVFSGDLRVSYLLVSVTFIVSVARMARSDSRAVGGFRRFRSCKSEPSSLW